MDDFLQMYSHMSRTDLKKYRIKSMLSNALEDGENTVIWFYGARVNLNVMMRKFTEDADDDEETLPAERGIREAWQTDSWKSEYTYMALSYKRCAQVQILITQEKFDEAHRLMRETISWLNRQVRNNRIREEYANGIRYLVDCLLAFCEVKNVKSTRSVEELKEDLERVTCYEELSDLEKCCVLGGRQFVRNILKFSINEQIDVLKKVIKMDPYNTSWRHRLYLLLSTKRRNIQRFEPTEDEERSITRAYSLPGGKSNPYIVLGYLVTLAEKFSVVLTGNQQFEAFFFGSKHFRREEDVIKRIRELTNTVLTMYPMSANINLNIAKIYSSILLRKYQNHDFAELCLNRALVTRPNSCKANHRVATFLLRRAAPKHLIIKYLRRAVDLDITNDFAVFDLYKYYMGDISTYRVQLIAMLNRALSHEYYQSNVNTLGEFTFWKAIYLWLDDKPSDCIDYFQDVHRLGSNKRHLFNKAKKCNAVNDWKAHDKIGTELKEFLKDVADGTHDWELKFAMNDTVVCLQHSWQFYNFKRDTELLYRIPISYIDGNTQDVAGSEDIRGKTPREWRATLGVRASATRDNIRDAYTEFATISLSQTFRPDAPHSEIMDVLDRIDLLRYAYEMLTQ